MKFWQEKIIAWSEARTRAHESFNLQANALAVVLRRVGDNSTRFYKFVCLFGKVSPCEGKRAGLAGTYPCPLPNTLDSIFDLSNFRVAQPIDVSGRPERACMTPNDYRTRVEVDS